MKKTSFSCPHGRMTVKAVKCKLCDLAPCMFCGEPTPEKVPCNNPVCNAYVPMTLKHARKHAETTADLAFVKDGSTWRPEELEYETRRLLAAHDKERAEADAA